MSIAFDGDSVVLGPALTADFLEFAPEKDGFLSEPGLLSRIKRMERVSLLFDSAQVEMLDEPSLRGSYIDKPELGRGRDESAHLVYFGQLILNSMTDHERPEIVAVKPYADDHRGALHELAVNTTVNRVTGIVRAFEPLGLWRDEAGNYSLITRYEHAVQSYDTVFWANHDESPEALTPPVIRKALRMSAFGVGLMHGLGIAHGDPQVKNLGSDNTRMRFIDLEEARLFPRQPDADTYDEEGARTLMERDWGIFVDSCFRQPENAESIAEAMLDEYEAIAKSYLKGVRRTRQYLNGTLSDEVFITKDDILAQLNKEIEVAIRLAEELDFDE